MGSTVDLTQRINELDMSIEVSQTKTQEKRLKKTKWI